MKMTFDQYIQNPMGVKNAVFSSREMYRNMYTVKLDAIMVRESGKANYFLFKDNERYIALIKTPSENLDNFYYDVVIEFTPSGKKSQNSKTLNDYNVRFYSNDPHFVFTFMHAFLKNGMFFTDLSDKMSKEAIEQKAKEKNPNNMVGYVKSIFFAYLIMKRFSLFNKNRYITNYNEKYLKSIITHSDDKIRDRQELQSQSAKKVRQEKIQKQKEEEIEKAKSKTLSSRSTRAINKVKTVGKTIKNTNRTKTTKIIK